MVITVNCVQLYYEKTGEGRPLIMAHCNSMDHKIFRKAVKVLSGHFTVYCPDTRDHGKSSRVKTLHYEDMAEDMVLSRRSASKNRPFTAFRMAASSVFSSRLRTPICCPL